MDNIDAQVKLSNKVIIVGGILALSLLGYLVYKTNKDVKEKEERRVRNVNPLTKQNRVVVTRK